MIFQRKSVVCVCVFFLDFLEIKMGTRKVQTLEQIIKNTPRVVTMLYDHGKLKTAKKSNEKLIASVFFQMLKAEI